MSGHTPGPWRVVSEWIDDSCGSEVEMYSVVGPNDGDLILDQPIDEGDARLISAAPDLLEALDYALSALAHCRADKGYGSMQSRAANLAANAIAKARGEK